MTYSSGEQNVYAHVTVLDPSPHGRISSTDNTGLPVVNGQRLVVSVRKRVHGINHCPTMHARTFRRGDDTPVSNYIYIHT